MIISGEVAVLVVEDEPPVRMDIADQLAEAGYRVFEAANADQAVAILENEPSIRILFTDIDMPGTMDGLKLAAAVRDRWPPVKIVVTSGHRRVESNYLPNGAVFHVKPYHHQTIIESFRTLMN